MTVVFHIGYPKAASTWLQENFFPKIKNVKFIDNKTTHLHFFLSDVFLFDPILVRNTFDKNQRLLFSSESIVSGVNLGWHYGAYAKTQADKIKATYPEAKILIIIRNQQSLITSAYQQFIKCGGVESFNTYINSNKYFRLEHLHFYLLIEYYEKLFGTNNVYVYMYEEFLRNPRSFIKRLCNDLELEVDQSEINFSPTNIRLRIGLIPILRFCNLFHRYPRLKIQYFIHIRGAYTFVRKVLLPLNKYKILGRYSKPSDFIKKNNAEKIKNFYIMNNSLLTDRFTIESLKENGYIYE